jgi:hypothetical protein
VVVAELFKVGDHNPNIGVVFVELEGKINAAPEQIAGTCVNVGVTFGVTFTVICAVEAHNPAVGVKV